MKAGTSARACAGCSLAPVLVALAACSSGPDVAPGSEAHPASVERLVEHDAPPRTLRISNTRPGVDVVTLFPADYLDRPVGDRVSVASAGGTLHVRSVREFSLAPVVAGAPLIERTDQAGRPLAGWGTVRTGDTGFLGELLNTGWVASLPDGGAAFAYALEPEVVRFDASGREAWRSVRPAPVRRTRPALVRAGSSIRPDFTEVQHGIAAGPDGRLYVLAGATRDSVQIDVLEANGAFVRAGRVPRGHAISVDRRGRVFVGVAPKEEARPDARRLFSDFDLPELNGSGRIRLSDHKGKAVVINVWASWCAPCRFELPALDSLAAELGPDTIAILGLNEDHDPGGAQRFLRRLGGVRFPLASGRGQLRQRLGYRGLPYTVVLDREHRVVSEIHGFGGSLEAVRRAVAVASANAPAARH